MVIILNPSHDFMLENLIVSNDFAAYKVRVRYVIGSHRRNNGRQWPHYSFMFCWDLGLGGGLFKESAKERTGEVIPQESCDVGSCFCHQGGRRP